MAESLKAGIIGCGLIGRKRADALTEAGDELVTCFDVTGDAARSLAADFGAEAAESAEQLLAAHIDVAIIATPHNRLAETAIAALGAGAHVLVEKPAGISSAEVAAIESAATDAGKRVKVGFNHRFHPGIARAISEAHSGDYGDVMFARGRYGHGGRIGYEKEWRADAAISGGGEMIDQGMHMLDLFHWLLGPLPVHSSLLRTQFWPMDVEDNSVFTLAGPERDGPWATAHVTWTEWKNMFSLEIYCRTVKLAVEGLAGSYGPQSLTIYRMKPEMGPPDVERIDYPKGDPSWLAEWEHFRAALTSGDPVLGDLESARYAWQCVEAAYEQNGMTRG